MGTIYKVLSEHNCAALSLADAEKLAKENGVFIIPKKEAALSIAGGHIVEVQDDQKN